VIEEFHWSRGLAAGALMLGSVLWTLSAPVIGILLDRFGPRTVLPAGALIMATGFVISGLANSVFEFYVGRFGAADAALSNRQLERRAVVLVMFLDERIQRVNEKRLIERIFSRVPLGIVDQLSLAFLKNPQSSCCPPEGSPCTAS
jgi:hypothetical protein